MAQFSGRTLFVAINVSFVLGLVTHKTMFSTPSPVSEPKVVKSTVDKKVVEPTKAVKTKVLQSKSVVAQGARSFGGPLDYRKAHNGVIKGLPNSKLPSTGILVDLNSRKVLWAKNPRTAVPIASMTKMMTLLLAFEDIADPRNNIDQDTVVKVTRESSKIGGSQVWLDPRESFPLSELLKCVAVKSANDAAYLVGQFLGKGSVSSFVKRMNYRAKELGMKNTQFSNPHGLPESSASRDNKSTPEDLVILTEHLLQYPDAVRLSSTWRDKFRNGKFDLQNSNRLVEGNKYGGVQGVDGMKTGFIDRAGFCTTVTCKRDGRRLVAVVTGFKDASWSKKSKRDPFVTELLEWGYAR